MRRRGLLAALPGVLAGCSTPRRPTGPLTPPPGTGDGNPGTGTGTETGAAAVGDGDDGTEGSDGTDVPGLLVSDWEFAEDPDGRLRVEATIANDATDEQSGVLVAEGAVDGEPFERRREVTVAGGGTATVELVIDVEYDTWEGSGTLRLVIESE